MRACLATAMIAAVSVLLMLSCDGGNERLVDLDPPGIVAFDITGKVTDEASGDPIDSAQVLNGSIGFGYRTYTDSLGNYRTTGAEGHEAVLTVTKDGYLPAERHFPPMTNNLENVDFALEPDTAS